MPLDAPAVLDLWDRAEGLAPVPRSVRLAAAADPELEFDEAAAIPLGERDRRLLRLRSKWSAGELTATVVCPECHAINELTVPVDRLLRSGGISGIGPIEVGGRVITWRPINSVDVQLASAAGKQDHAEQILIERCVLEVKEGQGPVASHLLSSCDRSALARAIEAADPLGETLFDMHCVACGHGFVAELDIAETVWTELAGMARRLLGEVDTLAKIYGWTESECLALSPSRRAWYLQMATG